MFHNNWRKEYSLTVSGTSGKRSYKDFSAGVVYSIEHIFGVIFCLFLRLIALRSVE